MLSPLVEPFFRAIEALGPVLLSEPSPSNVRRFRMTVHCLYLLTLKGLAPGLHIDRMLDLGALMPQPGFFITDILFQYLVTLRMLVPLIHSLPEVEPLLQIVFNMTLLLKADIPRGSGILGQVFLLLHAAIPQMADALDR
ncbi:hypothetical protein H696_06315, partial [Fonticula alba]